MNIGVSECAEYLAWQARGEVEWTDLKSLTGITIVIMLDRVCPN